MSLNYAIYALLASQAFAWWWPLSLLASPEVSQDTQKSSEQPASLLASQATAEMTRENIRQVLASVEELNEPTIDLAYQNTYSQREMSRGDIRQVLASVEERNEPTIPYQNTYTQREMSRGDIRQVLASVQDDKDIRLVSEQPAILMAGQDTHTHKDISSNNIRQVLSMVQSDGKVGEFNSGFTRGADVGRYNFSFSQAAESGPKKCRKCSDIGKCLGDMLPTMLKPHFEMEKKSFAKATSNPLFVSMMENMVYTCDVSEGEDCHSSEQASLITTEKDMLDKILCKSPCTFELWKVEHNCGSQFDYDKCKALIADQEKLGSQAKMLERSEMSKEVMEALTQQLDTTASHKCD